MRFDGAEDEVRTRDPFLGKQMVHNKLLTKSLSRLTMRCEALLELPLRVSLLSLMEKELVGRTLGDGSASMKPSPLGRGFG